MARMRYYSGLWKVKSKGAVLVLILHFLFTSALMTFSHLFLITAEMNFRKNSSTAVDVYELIRVVLGLSAVASPVAGWLADVYLGRYKVLKFGLWALWAGVLTMTITAVLLYKYEDCTKCQSILYYSGGLVGTVLVSIGISAYAVNAVQFGIDQMPEASSDELSAYIHWCVWVVCAGSLILNLTLFIRKCVSFASDSFIGAAVQLMVPMTMLSLALCCVFVLRGWLIIEPGSSNSLRMIVRVLKFAATHKYPIKRRAITYTEDEKPSRIDFAKDKYGGPYTTEQVEDVKTFFRIVVIVMSTTTLSIPLFLFLISFNYVLHLTCHDSCSLMGRQNAYSASTFAVLITPLYTVVIYPLIRKRLLTMLLRVTVVAALMVLMCGALLVVDATKHALDPDIACIFTKISEDDQMLRVELWMAIPFKFFAAVGVVLYETAILEFVCAQSPYTMRGLLTGLFYSTTCLAAFIAYGIFNAWSKFSKHISPSCDFYYFLFQFLCAVVGLIVLCAVTRWYKRRRREEEDDQRRIVEEIYDRMLPAPCDSENCDEEEN